MAGTSRRGVAVSSATEAALSSGGVKAVSRCNAETLQERRTWHGKSQACRIPRSLRASISDTERLDLQIGPHSRRRNHEQEASLIGNVILFLSFL